MYTINAATQRLIEAGILADPSYVPREKELNRFGVMVWDHKTGGSCQIMTGDSFSNAKQYMAQPGHRSGIRKCGFRG
jgi:hypothetical protein